MNNRTSLLLCGLFFLSLFSFSARLAAQSPSAYQVKPGETLFSIARRHGTTAERIVQANPGLKSNYIQAGQTINIPTTSKGAVSSSEVTSVSSPKKQVPPTTEVNHSRVGRADETSQPTVTYKEYKVKRKETAYGIARANNITVEQLMDANPYLKKEGFQLKRGMFIRIPVFTYPPKPKYVGLTTINVAVVLPFIGESAEYERSIEFYRGILLGIEDLREKGTNFTLRAYNEPAPDKSIASLMTEVMNQHPDLVIGPLYPTHFNDVTAVTSERTKVAIPFSSKVPQVNFRPDVFVINTPYLYESDFATDLFLHSFTKETAVVMLSSVNGDKKTFCGDLRRKLLNSGYQVIGLPASSGSEAIASALRTSRLNHFVILGDDSSEAALSALLDKVKALRTAAPSHNYSILGYNSWIKLSEGKYKQDLHASDAYIISSSYYYPHTTKARLVNERYRRWFKSDYLPDADPKMGPLGYDFATGFLGAMTVYGHAFNTQAPDEYTESANLQSEMRFRQVAAGGGYVSRSMWLVHFKKDMSIVKISAR